tara:strand:+ start:62 stop:310 length:249 start_codon:yes stop_codon:yes gene_type:complete
MFSKIKIGARHFGFYARTNGFLQKELTRIDNPVSIKIHHSSIGEKCNIWSSILYTSPIIEISPGIFIQRSDNKDISTSKINN